LTATKDGPVVDEVLPAAGMIQEDRPEFPRSGGKPLIDQYNHHFSAPQPLVKNVQTGYI
jgi:hypothetical protein